MPCESFQRPRDVRHCGKPSQFGVGHPGEQGLYTAAKGRWGENGEMQDHHACAAAAPHVGVLVRAAWRKQLLHGGLRDLEVADIGGAGTAARP